MSADLSPPLCLIGDQAFDFSVVLTMVLELLVAWQEGGGLKTVWRAGVMLFSFDQGCTGTLVSFCTLPLDKKNHIFLQLYTKTVLYVL